MYYYFCNKRREGRDIKKEKITRAKGLVKQVHDDSMSQFIGALNMMYMEY